MLVEITKHMSEASFETTLFDLIISMHLNHEKYSQYFSWFMHLVQEVPSILKEIEFNQLQFKSIKVQLSVYIYMYVFNCSVIFY